MSRTHFAIVAPPLPGHWDPLRVLAAELTSRGHRVTFLHMPDAKAMLKGTPFAFQPVGIQSHGSGALADYRRRLGRAPSIAGFFPMLRASAAISAMLLRDLPDALRRIGAQAVIGDETEPVTGLVAQHIGLPWITSVTGLPLLRDPLVPPPFLSWRFRDDEAGLKRNAGGYLVADRLMRPISRVIEQQAQAWRIEIESVHAGSPLLQVAQCPPGLDFPRRALPRSFHYCGPFRAGNPPPPVALATDRPLVYCSLGSLQGNRPRLFAAMTRACADVGARAVVAHGGLLGDAAARALPGDPISAAFWPQPSVLPLCRAALLHGGFNTVLDALAAGVPMAVHPLAFEQPGTAARIARSGAGIVSRGRLTRGKLRRTLTALLEQMSYRTAAQHLAQEISGLGGASHAADLIEEALRITPRPPG